RPAVSIQDGTVLVVEDDANDALFIERAFSKAGHEGSAVVVPDVEGAIAYVSGIGAYTDRLKFPLPGVVLLDLKLPGKNGFYFLEWYRRRPEFRHVPVLVFTSSRHEEDIRRAYDLGATSFVLKPGGFDEL